MPFIVEDGTGVIDANALISVAFADDYFLLRGVTDWTGLDSEKEVAIIKSTDYMELMFSQKWNGYLSEEATELSFPRVYFYSPRKGMVDFETDGIPKDIMKACAEYALRALTVDLISDPEFDNLTGKEVKSKLEKVGPLEEETSFVTGASSSVRSYPAADRLIRPYLIGTGGVIR